MIRLFDTHKVRAQRELCGLWDFAVVEEFRLPKIYNEAMPVPSCWEMNPKYVNYRGYGAYRTVIQLSHKTNLRLEFKGVSHTAEVYFDGKKIAWHYNAYTPFSAIVQNADEGEHIIEVLVDNTYSDSSILHFPNDYYTYGGLIRPIVIEETADCYIKRLKFKPYFDGVWKADIGVYIESTVEKDVEVKGILDKALDFGKVHLNVGETVIEGAFEFKDITPWQVKQPSLYDLTANIIEKGIIIDDLIERIGFREIKYTADALLVNDKKVFIKGFNRHEDHGEFGSSIPFSQMVADIELMCDMGGNAVRTCHYPNDELFLDLCDKYGLLVWEEHHARAIKEEKMDTDLFDRQCSDCNREMVENHYNHPSIFIWGILNECASDKEHFKPKYKAQLEQIKSMDDSRPTSFASNKYYKDVCLDLEDIVSFNLYYGWYWQETAGDEIHRVLDWVNKNGGKGKGFIVSEFGAGGIYGSHDPILRQKWTEERQCDILEENISTYMNTDGIIGIFIWQFCDCRIDESDRALGRPNTRNNKGIVDSYRRPKSAYMTVKRCFNEGK